MVFDRELALRGQSKCFCLFVTGYYHPAEKVFRTHIRFAHFNWSIKRLVVVVKR